MRRSRRVVPDHRRGADEDRPGAEPRQERLRVGDPQLEVLGRVLLRELDRAFEARDVANGHVLAAPTSERTAADRPGSRLSRDRLAVRPVLRLRQQVGRTPLGARGAGSSIRTTSLGPAGRSIPTEPATRSFMAVTQRFPGPTILSTRPIVSVPYASAATACAPPTAYTSSIPSSHAAARVARGTRCDDDDALHARQPRRTAAIASEDGYDARPPGT